MHEQHKNLIDKCKIATIEWLKSHKQDGQYIGDFDGLYDLDDIVLDGCFDLTTLNESILEVIKGEVEKIKIKNNDNNIKQDVVYFAETIMNETKKTIITLLSGESDKL